MFLKMSDSCLDALLDLAFDLLKIETRLVGSNHCAGLGVGIPCHRIEVHHFVVRRSNAVLHLFTGFSWLDLAGVLLREMRLGVRIPSVWSLLNRRREFICRRKMFSQLKVLLTFCTLTMATRIR